MRCVDDGGRIAEQLLGWRRAIGELEIGGGDLRAFAEDERAFEDVLELANIAGPTAGMSPRRWRNGGTTSSTTRSR